jgi:trimethylamine--corrinoid protein Co-methyltransferase
MIHSAGVLGGYRSLSYEKFLADVELIGMIEHIIGEVPVDDVSLALDVIEKVGPGKEYISAKHTVKNFRKAHWQPQVSLRGSFDSSAGDQLYQQALQDRKESLLNSYTRPDLDPKIIKELSTYLTEHGYAVII